MSTLSIVLIACGLGALLATLLLSYIAAKRLPARKRGRVLVILAAIDAPAILLVGLGLYLSGFHR